MKQQKFALNTLVSLIGDEQGTRIIRRRISKK